MGCLGKGSSWNINGVVSGTAKRSDGRYLTINSLERAAWHTQPVNIHRLHPVKPPGNISNPGLRRHGSHRPLSSADMGSAHSGAPSNMID
jgi:hypothetical protein